VKRKACFTEPLLNSAARRSVSIESAERLFEPHN
jgi:hypothetical protein